MVGSDLESGLDFVDPAEHVGGAGVDSGEVGLAAADAPTHDSDLRSKFPGLVKL